MSWKDRPADSGFLTERQMTSFNRAAKQYSAAAFALNTLFALQRPFPTQYNVGLSFSDIAAHKARITAACASQGLTRRKVENLAHALTELAKLAPPEE